MSNQTLPQTFFQFQTRNASKIEFNNILSKITKSSYDKEIMSKIQEKREKIMNYLSASNVEEFVGASADYLSLFQALVYTPTSFKDVETTEDVPLLQNFNKDGVYSKFRKIFTFQWSSSLKKSQQIMINDSLFEIYSVLYNVAICQMNDILKGTEIPSKIKTLLQCAGIFEYLETLNDLQEIQDVSVKLSSALKLICQSQSEEFVISMCYEKDDKHERMAQVARDAMKNYQKIASLIKSIDVLNSFKCYVNYKASYCEMLSLLFSGIFYNKSDENGKAIAMVKHCKSKIDEHKKVTKCYLAELTDKKDVEYQLEWLTATIDRYLSKFNKENDLVYHQKVPDQVPEPCDEKAFGKIEKFQLMPVSEEWKKEIFDGFKFNDSFLPSNSSTLGSSDNSSKLIQPNSSGETDEKTEGKTDGEGVKTKEDDIGGCSLCVLL